MKVTCENQVSYLADNTQATANEEAYRQIEAAAWAAYSQIEATAWAAYAQATAPSKNAYSQIMAAAREAYKSPHPKCEIPAE